MSLSFSLVGYRLFTGTNCSLELDTHVLNVMKWAARARPDCPGRTQPCINLADLARAIITQSVQKSDKGVAKTRLWPAAAAAFIAGEPIERGAVFADALHIMQHFEWSPFDLSGANPAFWAYLKTGFTFGIPNPVFKYELASASLFGD